jgi:hypothetical protein
MVPSRILVFALCLWLGTTAGQEATPPNIVGPDARSKDSAWTDGAIDFDEDSRFQYQRFRDGSFSYPYVKFLDRNDLSVVLNDMEQIHETMQGAASTYGLTIIYKSLEVAEAHCLPVMNIESMHDPYVEIAGNDDIGVCVAKKCGPPTLEGMKKIRDVISAFDAAYPGVTESWTIAWGECVLGQ